MNLLSLLGKIIFAFGMSAIVGLLIALLTLSVLSIIVNFFQLNYIRNNYWVVNLSLFVWWITWIISFGYYMTRM